MFSIFHLMNTEEKRKPQRIILKPVTMLIWSRVTTCQKVVQSLFLDSKEIIIPPILQEMPISIQVAMIPPPCPAPSSRKT